MHTMMICGEVNLASIAEERDLIVRQIAGMLDHPNVYMGGPSSSSLRTATGIVGMLERSHRLVQTTCDHSDYGSYREHGVCCPRCGLKIREAE
jgi:hypothetical protein